MSFSAKQHHFCCKHETTSLTLLLVSFFRLDTTAKTLETARSAKDSSWCCGWKESSLQWPLLIWGSKQPQPTETKTKCSWGPSHRALLRSVFSNPNPFSAVNRCALWRLKGRRLLNQHVQRAPCPFFKQTPSLIKALLCGFLRVGIKK